MYACMCPQCGVGYDHDVAPICAEGSDTAALFAFFHELLVHMSGKHKPATAPVIKED